MNDHYRLTGFLALGTLGTLAGWLASNQFATWLTRIALFHCTYDYTIIIIIVIIISIIIIIITVVVRDLFTVATSESLSLSLSLSLSPTSLLGQFLIHNHLVCCASLLSFILSSPRC
jgi:hypothetical protein